MSAVDSACMWWVRRYTSRLPTVDATGRIAEIEADVWEHRVDAADAGTGSLAINVDVMRRVLSGVPADLSWRREVLRSRERSASEGVPVMSRVSNVVSASTVVVAALCALPALAIAPLLGTAIFGGFNLAELLWMLAASTLGALLIWGLVLRMRGEQRRKATTLLVVGAPAPAVAWFWFPPLYLLSAILIVLALMSHDRTKQPSPALTA